jgi:hypothetical protein
MCILDGIRISMIYDSIRDPGDCRSIPGGILPGWMEA